jgi:predicted Zn-ribbon and HTH transcriptional regulator
MRAFAILFLILILSCCQHTVKKDDYLLSFQDSTSGACGFKNQKGEIIIPEGKYQMCFTDTFKSYAIVSLPKMGIVGIDRKENVLYEVFPFDNGPDNASDGLFRIMANNKIGYADAVTGAVVITPQFDCAFPFEDGQAKVSNKCSTIKEGEHHEWISEQWYKIDRKGQKVDAKK